MTSVSWVEPLDHEQRTRTWRRAGLSTSSCSEWPVTAPEAGTEDKAMEWKHDPERQALLICPGLVVFGDERDPRDRGGWAAGVGE